MFQYAVIPAGAEPACVVSSLYYFSNDSFSETTTSTRSAVWLGKSAVTLSIRLSPHIKVRTSLHHSVTMVKHINNLKPIHVSFSGTTEVDRAEIYICLPNEVGHLFHIFYNIVLFCFSVWTLFYAFLWLWLWLITSNLSGTFEAHIITPDENKERLMGSLWRAVVWNNSET